LFAASGLPFGAAAKASLKLMSRPTGQAGKHRLLWLACKQRVPQGRMFLVQIDYYLGMPLDALIWVLLPIFVAAGSALLCFSIMQARAEVAIAREREALAQVRASVNSSQVSIEDRMRAVEAETRHKALNEFMGEFRVQERHYVRESKSATMRRKIMVTQERLYFRNIPLSNWIEHEMTMEEASGDPQGEFSMFTTKALADSSEVAAAGLLQ
jgi:hypothetical protein